MKFLRSLLDKAEAKIHSDKKFRILYPLYEAADTFLFTPKDVTTGSTHVRDAMDLKRMMFTVAIALQPCILWGMYNTGFQANSVLAQGGADMSAWRLQLMSLLGIGFDPSSIISNIMLGMLYFLPIFLVTNIAGGLCELLFATVRKHEINEGFLVTGLLYPLILPATIPLWQVAIGIIFGVVIGKEVFGGTGKNFLNPALTARAFLYFAYPAQMSGNAVWTAVDGYTGATALGLAAEKGMAAVETTFGAWNSFIGLIPGSIGETSLIAILIGAVILLLTGVGSWRIMLSCVIGVIATSGLLNFVGSDTNMMFQMTPLWHFLVGGLAFGIVFMATDPVSAAMTPKGKYFYGFLIGLMAVLIRVVNPAFPEGIMLAILFGNVFAPLIDYYVVKANIRRRKMKSV